MKNSPSKKLKNNIYLNNEAAVRLSPQRFDIAEFTNAYKEIDTTAKEIKHYVSSEGINSKGQDLPIAGYKDELYRKNPMVLFNHGLDAMWNEPTDPRESLMYAIGTNLWVQPEGNYLKAKTKFNENNAFAMDLFEAYVNGFMNAWSKRWRPISAVLYDEDGNITVNEWSMREYSSVFIPADDGATTIMENSINDFKSDLFKNCIKDLAFKNTVQNDGEVQKLIKEINDLKTLVNNLPVPEESAGVSKEEVQTQINESIKIFADHNQERFLGIAGSIENLANSTNNRFAKIDSEMNSKISKGIAGVIRESVGKV